MRTCLMQRRRAFTLIELLVVVAIIALLISILLPALGRAREQSRGTKCLSNVRSMGLGVVTYAAEEKDALPGPVHPAVYRNQGIDALMDNPIRTFSAAAAQAEQKRFLSYRLKRVFNDSHSRAGSISDKVSTCPTLLGVIPDSAFLSFKNRTSRAVFPTHYVVNNVGPATVDGGDTGGALNNVRTTDPAFYFGYSPHDASNAMLQDIATRNPPRTFSKIRESSREWMIADAWYRKRANAGFPEFQQEGPYQWDWSGEALPNFAPHGAASLGYSFSTTADRDSSSTAIRNSRQDGRTSTVFMDGHGELVKSRRLLLNGTVELLYGFQGTQNPKSSSTAAALAAWE